jgi:hypothetical protein
MLEQIDIVKISLVAELTMLILQKMEEEQGLSQMSLKHLRVPRRKFSKKKKITIIRVCQRDMDAT